MAGPLDADIQVLAASSIPDIDEDISLDDAVAVVEEWFLHNFEDPVHSTPYSSEDGGYSYVWGGPFEASEILDEAYDYELRSDVKEEVLSSLEAMGDTWVISQGRILPPDDDEEAESAGPVEASHQSLLEKVGAVERVLAEIDQARGGIGHNRPPESIDEEPITDLDRREMGEALSLLKAQPAQPSASAFMSIEAALGTLRKAAIKIGSYLAQRGNDFVTSAVKSAGDATGKAIIGLGAWSLLGNEVNDLIAAGLKWLGLINPPF